MRSKLKQKQVQIGDLIMDGHGLISVKRIKKQQVDLAFVKDHNHIPLLDQMIGFYLYTYANMDMDINNCTCLQYSFRHQKTWRVDTHTYV